METGKTGKYLKYAIGEIILVVIGILIALQINKWHEHRNERVEEQKILKTIQAGFKFNKIEVKQNIDETNYLVERTKSVNKTFGVSDTLTNEYSNKLIKSLRHSQRFIHQMAP